MTQELVIDGEVTTNVGTKVVFEDERVRIWDLSLAPGEQTDVHEHKLPYIIITLEGDRVAAIPHPKSTGDSAHYIEAEVNLGDFYVMPTGGIETAKNVGKKPFRELLIELKY